MLVFPSSPGFGVGGQSYSKCLHGFCCRSYKLAASKSSQQVLFLCKTGKQVLLTLRVQVPKTMITIPDTQPYKPYTLDTLDH